jgi:ATP-dependent Clp protease ATP-binding subunit ClpA
LETAAEEAHLAGSEYIGTEHLITRRLGREGAFIETLLGRYGVFYEQIRGAVKYLTASREDASGREEKTPPRRRFPVRGRAPCALRSWTSSLGI